VYCGDNPIAYSDKTGLFKHDPEVTVSFGIRATLGGRKEKGFKLSGFIGADIKQNINSTMALNFHPQIEYRSGGMGVSASEKKGIFAWKAVVTSQFQWGGQDDNVRIPILKGLSESVDSKGYGSYSVILTGENKRFQSTAAVALRSGDFAMSVSDEFPLAPWNFKSDKYNTGSFALMFKNPLSGKFGVKNSFIGLESHTYTDKQRLRSEMRGRNLPSFPGASEALGGTSKGDLAFTGPQGRLVRNDGKRVSYVVKDPSLNRTSISLFATNASQGGQAYLALDINEPRIGDIDVPQGVVHSLTNNPFFNYKKPTTYSVSGGFMFGFN
jgi:hypothetical protein